MSFIKVCLRRSNRQATTEVSHCPLSQDGTFIGSFASPCYNSKSRLFSEAYFQMATVKRKTELSSAAPRGAKAYSTTNAAGTTTATKPAARKVRRDWAQIAFLVLSVIIVLSMVLGTLSYLFQ